PRLRGLRRVIINPLSVSAAQSMSASLRKRPKCCVAAKRRYVPGAVINEVRQSLCGVPHWRGAPRQSQAKKDWFQVTAVIYTRLVAYLSASDDFLCALELKALRVVGTKS